jgi:hypothetical protein
MRKQNDTGHTTAGDAGGSLDPQLIEDAANDMYPGLQVHVRDANLAEDIAARYVKDMILHEPGYVDGSCRVGGMITTHRTAILSNHMLNEHDAFGTDDNGWGLCIASRGSHFKVLGSHVHHGKTIIVLLHLPNDDRWRLFRDINVNLDADVYASCIRNFERKCDMPPIPELATDEWLARCSFPVGMDEQGNYFPVD